MTPLGGGGNKGRKLHLILPEVLAQGCDTLVTAGAAQSNSVRQVAAAAARCGLACVALCVDEPHGSDVVGGNPGLAALAGADLVWAPLGTDYTTALWELAETLRADGHAPFVIPVGASSALGNCGYVAAAAEINAQQTGFDRVILASGSGGTQAGLIAGFADMAPETQVVGMSVSVEAAAQAEKVRGHLRALADLVDRPDWASCPIKIDDSALGPGYAQPDDTTWEAISLVAQTEGLFLDPTYTGKAMAGLIASVKAGDIPASAKVLFLHTGGLPGLLARHHWPDPAT